MKLLQSTQRASELEITPIQASLSFEFIIPSIASHEKVLMRSSTNPRHTPLITSWGSFGSALASSSVNDFTVKWPILFNTQIRASDSCGNKTTSFKSCCRACLSRISCGLRARAHEKLQLQFSPSHTPFEATKASGVVLILNSLGQTFLSGKSPTHISC